MAPRLKALPNPKDLYGVLKVPTFSVVPTTSLVYEALAMWDGAGKYGPFNWRDHPVKASVYIDALLRHMMQWIAGEERDRKSKVPHLGHAKACIGILVDAFETGNLIDDRAKNPALLRLLALFDRTPAPEASHGKSPAARGRRAARSPARRQRGALARGR